MRHQFGGPEPDNYPMNERIAREPSERLNPEFKAFKSDRMLSVGRTRYISHGAGYVTVEAGCAPFIVTEADWKAAPLCADTSQKSAP